MEVNTVCKQCGKMFKTQRVSLVHGGVTTTTCPGCSEQRDENLAELRKLEQEREAIANKLADDAMEAIAPEKKVTKKATKKSVKKSKK